MTDLYHLYHHGVHRYTCRVEPENHIKQDGCVASLQTWRAGLRHQRLESWENFAYPKEPGLVLEHLQSKLGRPFFLMRKGANGNAVMHLSMHPAAMYQYHSQGPCTQSCVSFPMPQATAHMKINYGPVYLRAVTEEDHCKVRLVLGKAKLITTVRAHNPLPQAMWRCSGCWNGRAHLIWIGKQTECCKDLL